MGYNSRMNKNQTEWVFGIHALESVLEQSPENIIHIMVAGNSNNPRLQKIISLARDLDLKLTK